MSDSVDQSKGGNMEAEDADDKVTPDSTSSPDAHRSTLNGQDESDEEDTAAEQEEEAPAISALPPRVILQEEGQMEVSSSPAFQCLDDLFQDGRLTGTKVALLKAKYTELHETLRSTRKNEINLLNSAKDLTSDLADLHIELDKGDHFPDLADTDVSRLRLELLKYNNEMSEASERQYQLEYMTECLTEEQKLLEREYSRMPKQGEVEKKIKELQTSSDDLKKEIAQRQLEAKNLKEDIETKHRQYTFDNKDYEVLTEQLENLKAELVSVNSLPNQIAKEADKILRQKNDVDNQRKKLDGEFTDMLDGIKQFEVKRQAMEDEKYGGDSELDKQRSLLNAKERDFNMLMKEYEYAKDREAVLLGDRATIDLNLRHILMEKKNQHEFHSRRGREKDRDLRNLKKIELQLKNVDDSLNHTQSVYEKIKGQMNSLPKDDGSLLKKRGELQKEVEQTKRALAQQNSLTAVEHVKLEASAAEEQDLLYEQSDLRIEVVELTRLAQIKADEREQKARDFMRAEMRYHKAVEDLKSRQLQIQDHHKKHQELQIKLKEFAQLYDVIKNERNKCVNLIQTSTQKAAEMREKIKILANEIEILRTAVSQKDKLLQKQRLKHMNSIVLRDSLRNEVAKQHHLEEEIREKREQQKMDIAKLNMMINQAEEQMVKLRKRYETAVQHRNKRGIDLIERNEEVCIFYEKVNTQDQMIRNGNVELQGREEEIRFLKMQHSEEKRSIGLLMQSMPGKRSMEDELVTLQIQLSQCQDRMLELEKQLENPYDESRVHFLEGKDLSPADLQQKLEELEMRLAEKEEKLLEKDLVFEQVTRLADRVKNKAETGKEDTLTLAKKVNEIQGEIKDMTRKMMALVSELSMNQALALRHQHDLHDHEGALEQAYTRMEKGQPPSSEAEREWLRYLRDLDKKSREDEDRQFIEEEEEQYRLAGGVTTTAEPRPNAYIPDDENQLPVPRPYGKHAPFKPSDPGSNMRHVRKPIPKPIEI